MFGDHRMFADNHLEIIIPQEKLSYTHFLLKLLTSEKPDTAVPRKPLPIAQAILHLELQFKRASYFTTSIFPGLPIFKI